MILSFTLVVDLHHRPLEEGEQMELVEEAYHLRLDLPLAEYPLHRVLHLLVGIVTSVVFQIVAIR
jgi:hypothetical protein